MNALQIIAAAALGVTSVGLATRCRLLSPATRGWPPAHWPVRWGLGLLAAVSGLRALTVAMHPLARGSQVSAGEVLLYLAMALCALVLAVNLALQRSAQFHALVDRARAALHRGEPGSPADHAEPPRFPGVPL